VQGVVSDLIWLCPPLVYVYTRRLIPLLITVYGGLRPQMVVTGVEVLWDDKGHSEMVGHHLLDSLHDAMYDPYILLPC
jgi:hypothetical protein